METQYLDEFRRLQIDPDRHGTQHTECFGFGQDGLVYATIQESVMKCLKCRKIQDAPECPELRMKMPYGHGLEVFVTGLPICIQRSIDEHSEYAISGDKIIDPNNIHFHAFRSAKSNVR